MGIDYQEWKIDLRFDSAGKREDGWRVEGGGLSSGK